MAATSFELICEIEPATRPDLMRVRHQIGVLSRVASSFLIPDNHIGRATVSSVAVAHEVAQMGGRSIACLNARDRNLLGFRRDLLTAAAYGVGQFLFVYGDRGGVESRPGDLTVRLMMEEARAFSAAEHTLAPFRIGVTTGLRPLPLWKQEADCLFVQVGFSIEALLAWRRSTDFSGPVYAGVMVVASAAMGRKLSGEVPELAVPAELISRLEHDRRAGVAVACDLVAQIRASGVFDGVHLIPVSRYREVAAILEGDGTWS
ncbi:MAG: 5 10-methylenetetrahydrofolate reductase-like protein [Acidimicrobiia bacterium]|nr:5 10-methylenetetrahydrofolate reductase-like protein [Acidimicrobiia bacterium]